MTIQEEKRINDCDPESFFIFNAWFSKDKNNIYFENLILDEADPETFYIDTQENNTAHDKNSSYTINLDDNKLERILLR